MDYKNSKIYKIVNDENDNFYIGSTCSTLVKRMSGHRKKDNQCMSKNLGVELKECKIILVEAFECKNKDELLMKERFYIEKYRDEGLNIVNKRIPIRSKQEAEQCRKKWYKDNIVIIAQKAKQKREENKEIIKEKQHLKYLKNKERINKKAKEWRDKNKQSQSIHNKEYNEKNKEKITKQKKEYYLKNKEKILERCRKYRLMKKNK